MSFANPLEHELDRAVLASEKALESMQRERAAESAHASKEDTKSFLKALKRLGLEVHEDDLDTTWYPSVVIDGIRFYRSHEKEGPPPNVSATLADLGDEPAWNSIPYYQLVTLADLAPAVKGLKNYMETKRKKRWWQ